MKKQKKVSFLHVYHHFSIAWAWYAGVSMFPGGDAYFGALLNSFIHVLMYSYYALALLKIPCPWKKYLTQAQLIQFTSVVIYSVFSYMGYPEDQRETKHALALAIQVWEMMSLFVLFSFFYARSYGKKKKKNKGKKLSMESEKESEKEGERDDDQCQKAVTTAVAGAAEVVETAAKDASKIANQARRSMRYNISST